MEWSWQEEMKWLGRIQKAVKRGTFTQEDKVFASQWNTCMVSERPNTRHDSWGEPISKTLIVLGKAFNQAVHNDNPEEALELRKKILAR